MLEDKIDGDNNVKLINAKLMDDRRGIIFYFKKGARMGEVLEDVLELLNDYYADIFYPENPKNLPYKLPENVTIKPFHPSRKRANINPDRLNFVMIGQYKKLVIQDKLTIWEPYEVVLGFLNFWPGRGRDYAAFLLSFSMRDRVLLGGRFKDNLDVALTEQEAKGFLEYVKSKKALPPTSQPYLLQE